MATDDLQTGKKPLPLKKKLNLQERIFKYLWIFICILVVTFIPNMIRYREWGLAHGSPSYSWQSLSGALVVSLIIMIVRYGAHPFLRGAIDKMLDSKYGADSREAQIDKLVKWIFDIIYYTTMTITGILILGQNDYLPTLFGGQGTCLNIMQRYPFVTELPYLQIFALVQIGHHLFSLIDQIFNRANTFDHHEMMLHHVLTVALVLTGYMMNILALGAVTTVILDPTDVLICLVRFSSDIKVRTSITALIFVATIAGWIFMRLYYFPVCILQSMWYAYTHPIGEMESIASSILLFQTVLLGALVPLSAYWVYRVARKGVLILAGRKGIKNE